MATQALLGAWPRAAGTAVWPRLLTALFAPVDIAALVYVRIVFGAVMLWQLWTYASLGWIADYYVDSSLNFTYLGFGWVRPWPGIGMYLHFAVLAVCAVGILFGAWYRLSAVLFTLGYAYVFLLEKTTYNNHYYLIILLGLLLAVVPAHRAFSIDARRRPALRSATAPGWTLWSLRAVVALPYLFGGIAKFHPHWLQGEPMRLWLADEAPYYPLLGQWFTTEWAPYLFSWGGLLFDLLIVPALLWRRTRVLAFGAAVLFHVGNAWLFPIGVFPPLMIALTALFFPPSWPRQLGLMGPAPGGAGPRSPSPPMSWRALSATRRLTVAGLALFFAVQVLAPLRHHVIAGDSAWTEEGAYFAWHMRLHDKWGVAIFHVTDPATGERWTVDPTTDPDVTEWQLGDVESQPDVILQFAHHLAARARAEGRGQVEVRADVRAALDGRPLQPLIDPTVDLAAQPRLLFGPVDWLLPFAEPTAG